jgi:hypothetical protein
MDTPRAAFAILVALFIPACGGDLGPSPSADIASVESTATSGGSGETGGTAGDGGSGEHPRDEPRSRHSLHPREHTQICVWLASVQLGAASFSLGSKQSSRHGPASFRWSKHRSPRAAQNSAQVNVLLAPPTFLPMKMQRVGSDRQRVTSIPSPSS